MAAAQKRAYIRQARFVGWQGRLDEQPAPCIGQQPVEEHHGSQCGQYIIQAGEINQVRTKIIQLLVYGCEVSQAYEGILQNHGFLFQRLSCGQRKQRPGVYLPEGGYASGTGVLRGNQQYFLSKLHPRAGKFFIVRLPVSGDGAIDHGYFHFFVLSML